MRNAETCIVAVFAKPVVAGEAKTRLIPALGAQGAAQLHAALARHALSVAIDGQVGRIELWCAGRDAALSALAAEQRIDAQLQHGDDLGARMADAFTRLLSRAEAAILIGTDCPARTAEDLREAATHLSEGCDAVLGPAEDGGYHLIGLRAPQPALFSGIPWSTDAVLSATRAKLRELRLRWHALPLRWDVDRPEDLERLRRDVRFAGLLHSHE
jgi:rSAM/selenodomain-associated transferase 1